MPAAPFIRGMAGSQQWHGSLQKSMSPDVDRSWSPADHWHGVQPFSLEDPRHSKLQAFCTYKVLCSRVTSQQAAPSQASDGIT